MLFGSSILLPEPDLEISRPAGEKGGGRHWFFRWWRRRPRFFIYREKRNRANMCQLRDVEFNREKSTRVRKVFWERRVKSIGKKRSQRPRMHFSLTSVIGQRSPFPPSTMIYLAFHVCPQSDSSSRSFSSISQKSAYRSASIMCCCTQCRRSMCPAPFRLPFPLVTVILFFFAIVHLSPFAPVLFPPHSKHGRQRGTDRYTQARLTE